MSHHSSFSDHIGVEDMVTDETGENAKSVNLAHVTDRSERERRKMRIDRKEEQARKRKELLLLQEEQTRRALEIEKAIEEKDKEIEVLHEESVRYSEEREGDASPRGSLESERNEEIEEKTNEPQIQDVHNGSHASVQSDAGLGTYSEKIDLDKHPDYELIVKTVHDRRDSEDKGEDRALRKLQIRDWERNAADRGQLKADDINRDKGSLRTSVINGDLALRAMGVRDEEKRIGAVGQLKADGLSTDANAYDAKQIVEEDKKKMSLAATRESEEIDKYELMGQMQEYYEKTMKEERRRQTEALKKLERNTEIALEKVMEYEKHRYSEELRRLEMDKEWALQQERVQRTVAENKQRDLQEQNRFLLAKLTELGSQKKKKRMLPTLQNVRLRHPLLKKDNFGPPVDSSTDNDEEHIRTN